VTPESGAAPPRRGRSFAPRYPGWLALPVLVYDAIFFLAPLAILVVFSLANTVGFGQVSYALSAVNFRELWDPLYLDIFKTTLTMAALGTVLTLLVGYPMAYWMARCLSGGKSLALILVIIPFLTSFLIRTYAWFIILDPQGFLVSFVHDLGFGGWRPLYTTQAIVFEAEQAIVRTQPKSPLAILANRAHEPVRQPFSSGELSKDSFAVTN